MLDTIVTDLNTDTTGAGEAPVSSGRRWRGDPDGTKHRSVCILGSHPATVMQTPFADPSAFVFACSPHNVEHRTLPRVDCWAELHDPIEDPTRAFAYLFAVSQMPAVLMRDKRALASGLFKGARPYPEKELKGTFTTQTIKVPTGSFQKVPDENGKAKLVEVLERRKVEVPNMDGKFSPHMLTSSIAYMLAKAIDDCEREGIREIGIFGVMQASETEFVYQRPGIQYFIGEAMKRGIKVAAPRESCLFDLPQWKW